MVLRGWFSEMCSPFRHRQTPVSDATGSRIDAWFSDAPSRGMLAPALRTAVGGAPSAPRAAALHPFVPVSPLALHSTGGAKPGGRGSVWGALGHYPSMCVVSSQRVLSLPTLSPKIQKKAGGNCR